MQEYLIDLDKQIYHCKEWQSTGIPCAHALAIIVEARKEDPQAYAKQFYTLEAFKKTYAGSIIHPHTKDFDQPLQFRTSSSVVDDMKLIDESSDSETNELLPPNTRRPTGRPKKRRIRSKSERLEGIKRRIQKCGRCNAVGHSRRTCRDVI